MVNTSQPAFAHPLSWSSRKMSTTIRKSRMNHMIHRKNQSMLQKTLSRG